MYSYTTCMTSRPELDRLTTMFTLMPRHERTLCGGSTSDTPGVALGSSGSPLLLQFMFKLTPQGRSVLAVCGHHTFAFSCNGSRTTRSAVDIIIKELVPLVVMAALWGGHWLHSHVCFHIDNEAVFAILQRQSGRSVMVQHLCCFYF